ncbi:uncharacterized protein B0J16DRAFT_390289 [Fusarium flagelliforme]|uniref:Uncharacterized protein n=1 Tax=Fusarium flagelliforme TaxID=2675880 RepID=A0A395MDV6_9HYPO|nr:uncharacterized protein B0J16DRAFT_390289 [Fusarium flagelliforme]KAH7196385.1 hypothetical protein B0J16DRAFT_390289 [Fusarium flagelliforme]RFN45433.1 hypothetical protein FIE12Z_10299 [Fusarium flagelliforme]
MKTYASITLLNLALLTVHAAQQKDIDASCNDVYGIVGCTRTIQYPGPIKETYDHTGAQNGIEVRPKDINICTAVQDALGNRDFVDMAAVNCGCLNMASYYGDDSYYKNTFDGQINQGVKEYYLDEIYKAETCLYNNDYVISTNKASVTRSQLSATNGWTVIKAPEVDVATYRKLIKAVASCYSGTCDGPKIRAFFASYVDKAENVIDSDLVEMLNDWVALFASLKQKTTELQTYAKQVQSRLKSVSSKVESVKASVCRNSACKGSTPTNAFKKFSNTISTIKGLQGVPSAAEKSLANIPKMTQITRTAIKYSTTAADEKYYVGLVEDYQINTIRDLIKAFRVTEFMPQAGEDLRNLVNRFNLISKHAPDAKAAATSIDQILATNWAKNSELAKTASGRKVRDGLIKIQKAFKDDLKGPLANLVKSNKAVEDLLVKFPLRKKRLEFASGGVYFNRWTDVQMKVPCSVSKTETFRDGIYTDDYTWYQIEACDFGPKKVNFVKHALPYIKYRFI